MLTTYRKFRGSSYKEAKNAISELSHDELVWLVINENINDFISDHCDSDKHAVSWWKAIPYIWRYWRSVDLYNKKISIWDCGRFIWFMENNKWDYPERELNDDEVEKLLSIIRDAKIASEKWWLLSDINKEKREYLSKIWDYMQTLKI